MSLQRNLCWLCSKAEGYILTIDPNFLLATTYQLKKFIKHIATPTWVTKGTNSLFADPATSTYLNYVTTTLASGSVVVDHRGPNFVWCAGESIGWTLLNGRFQSPSNAVKVVLPYQETKVHAYPVPAGDYEAVNCSKCGKPIFVE